MGLCQQWWRPACVLRGDTSIIEWPWVWQYHILSPLQALKVGEKHSVIPYSKQKSKYSVTFYSLLVFPQLYARSVPTATDQERLTTGSLWRTTLATSTTWASPPWRTAGRCASSSTAATSLSTSEEMSGSAPSSMGLARRRVQPKVPTMSSVQRTVKRTEVDEIWSWVQKLGTHCLRRCLLLLPWVDSFSSSLLSSLSSVWGVKIFHLSYMYLSSI